MLSLISNSRKRKRSVAGSRSESRAGEVAARRAYLESNNERNNSSRQSPLLSHLHNQRMQTGHELQSLPESILARIFIFSDLVQDEPIALPMSRDFIDENKMALLLVSYRLHRLALRMFWSANSFSIHIKNFNAGAILPWWTHVRAVRKGVEEEPIFMADPKMHNFVQADLTAAQEMLDPDTDPQDEDGHAKPTVHQEFLRDHEFKIQRITKPWSITRIPHGTVTLDVPYEPHWLNLKKWLYLFHKDDIPALTSSDIGSGQREWKDLHQIVGLFLSVQRETGGSWENVEKSLEGWQYTLKFADLRWQFEEGEDRAIEVEDTDEKADDYYAGGERDVCEEETSETDNHEEEVGENGANATEADQDMVESLDSTEDAASGQLAPEEIGYDNSASDANVFSPSRLAGYVADDDSGDELADHPGARHHGHSSKGPAPPNPAAAGVLNGSPPRPGDDTSTPRSDRSRTDSQVPPQQKRVRKSPRQKTRQSWSKRKTSGSYKIDGIIDEDETHYFVDWSEYDATWEPKKNVNKAAVAAWEDVKRAKQSG